MTPFTRPLHGVTVGVSISESEDAPARGFPPSQMDRVVRQVVGALFGQGARVIFGHDWRKDGVMETIHGFARQMQAAEVDPAAAPGDPLLSNFLPWPDEPMLSADERAQLASTLCVRQVGLPPELHEVAELARQEPRNGSLYRYLRARGLTHLRHELREHSDARICLGGRRSGSAGRYPGIIEEALLAVQSDQPLFLAGLLGGASAQAIDAVRQRPMPVDFCPEAPAQPPLSQLYAHPPVAAQEDPATQEDLQINREAAWDAFRHLGLEGLSERNALTPAENTELFETPSLERVIELCLSGLGRIKTRQH